MVATQLADIAKSATLRQQWHRQHQFLVDKEANMKAPTQQFQ